MSQLVKKHSYLMLLIIKKFDDFPEKKTLKSGTRGPHIRNKKKYYTSNRDKSKRKQKKKQIHIIIMMMITLKKENKDLFYVEKLFLKTNSWHHFKLTFLLFLR